MKNRKTVVLLLFLICCCGCISEITGGTNMSEKKQHIKSDTLKYTTDIEKYKADINSNITGNVDVKNNITTKNSITETFPTAENIDNISSSKTKDKYSISEKEQFSTIIPTTFKKNHSQKDGVIIKTNENSVKEKYQKKYIGEKISLDFYETDIKNVIRIINDISIKNFAVDSDVTGKVTMSLKTPVPWDQVLELILKMNRLSMVENGDIIRILTLKTLEREEKQLQSVIEASKKAKAEQQLQEPLITEFISVNYANAGIDVAPHITTILTPDRGTVSINERNNMLIITDVAKTIQKAKEIVKKIDQVIPQVIIEAKVIEVTDKFSRKLGITWQGSIGPMESYSLGGSQSFDAAFNYPVISDHSSIGFNFTRLAGTPLTLNAAITAAEANDDAKLVSSPKIITMDNKKASIKQGVEVAYLERDNSGGSSVKFKSANLLLEVTPHITPDRRIIMKLFITKNDVGVGETGKEPPLLTNEAQTELLIDDGDTIVIGGIVKTSSQGAVKGFPFLSKIPILGYLFKSTSKSKNKNELLIFITTKIVILGEER